MVPYLLALRPVLFAKNGYSRVRYALYHDQGKYEREQQHVFRGRTSLFLWLEAEIPNAGDFQSSWFGDTPLVNNRAPDAVRAPSSIAAPIEERESYSARVRSGGR